MDIGIGLPNAVEGTSGDQIIEFARRAERRGFSSVGTLDRIVYDSHEPLVALGAAAAATERIRFTTAILVGPPRGNDVLLAKQAATVQSISAGRLTLGIAIGARDDDYEASGVPAGGKGERFEGQLETLRRVWSGDEFGYAGRVGPVVDPPPVVLGGSSEHTFRRAAKYGDGWIMSAVGPDQFPAGAEATRKAWEAEGREGEPRLMSIGYYGLGPNAKADAERDLGHYYAWLGDEVAGMIAGSAPTDEESVKQMIQAFEEVGCQELILFPVASDSEQVDLLADVAGL
jgi:alkanesulfonate monooxygenase SsuD/methylene tetrahydromethanopterin reductase-like flavin-dependent oxidoreductase (luciferase family)